jgi:hypothetical protein
MSQLFITSRSNVNRHGVFAEQRRNPTLVRPTGTGIVGLVGQFPWGPDGEEIQPADAGERGLLLAPPGMDRSGSGWLAIAQKGWPDLRIVRVLGSAAVKASADLMDGVTEIAVVTLKYKGTAGNDCTFAIEAASDGDANHFNLRVRVSGASGFTEDLVKNINFSGVGDDSTFDYTNTVLIGSIVKSAAGRPDNATGSFTSGADGTINSTRYIGTAGQGDLGIAIFEGVPEVRCIFTDDPGNTDRAAVNAGLVAHAILMGSRVAVVSGNSGLSLSAAVAACAALTPSEFVAYADGWVYIRDEVTGDEVLVKSDSFLASVMAQLSPSTSPSWKGLEVRGMMAAIVRLETNRGNSAGTMTEAGICTLIKEEDGGYTWEAGVTTATPADATKMRLTRTRTAIYIASSIQRSLRPVSDAPLVPLIRQDMLNAVQRFLNGMKAAQNTNPIGEPHIIDWGFGDLEGVNPTASIQAGDFTIPIDITTSAGAERIFLSFNIGESVVVTAQAA